MKMFCKNDKLKALILLRKKQLGVTGQDLADGAKLHKQTVSNMMNRDSGDWRLNDVVSFCHTLGITKEEFLEAIEY